jgi:hypothetical protein
MSRTKGREVADGAAVRSRENMVFSENWVWVCVFVSKVAGAGR